MTLLDDPNSLSEISSAAHFAPDLARFNSDMHSLLPRFIQIESISGKEAEFARFVQNWAVRQGFETDLWETHETQVADYPQGRARHLPLAGRPTLVIRLPGQGDGPSLLFNAHSDVVAAPGPSLWRYGPWSGQEADGRIYGRGACDVKGPLISALWAMLAIKHGGTVLPGDLLLELVPGEEDCVGLGTLTSLLRGHQADGMVVLEPTENIPCRASRGGLRFELTCSGQAVHGTVKWLGRDAIQSARASLDALDKLEKRWNDKSADPLFAPFPLARPITVD
jgi:acetylornithine deacetylase